MSRTIARLLGANLAAIALCCAWSAHAAAQIAFRPCADTNDFACGKLTVPLDPSNPSAGTITLALRRHLSPLGDAKDAVIALAGGPGQAAIPLAEQFDRILGPVAATRDLIVFDQRGIGLSQPLSCAAFEHLAGREPSPLAIGICAQQIGPSRAFYTTADTVADIEAIREAGGYEKLVLYGTSYGTKVAERYAQTYPSHVEALVLDSVVPVNGPDQFRRSSFAAIPRILRRQCRHRACTHITSNTVGDLARVLRMMRRRPLRGRLIDEHGHPHTVWESPEDLLRILYAGDFDPFLRAELPAALRSAAQGDTAALARMFTSGESEESGENEAEALTEGFDSPLYLATSCEEQQFPWNRASSPAKRVREALERLRALPARTFAPFTAADALADSNILTCSRWPFATPAPETNDAPMPSVPTLIFSGEEDLRTPTADARNLARAIGGSRLVVVPDVGHAVLDSDPSPCSTNALTAFFAGKPIAKCRASRSPELAPFPRAPRRLAEVPPAGHSAGKPGRTLEAVVLTLQDLSRQLVLHGATQVATITGEPVDIGGLRSGWASYSTRSLRFHHYSYVPGVAISGTVTIGSAVLRIGGASAAHGKLRLGPGERLTGTLAGAHVHLNRLAEPLAVIAAATIRQRLRRTGAAHRGQDFWR